MNWDVNNKRRESSVSVCAFRSELRRVDQDCTWSLREREALRVAPGLSGQRSCGTGHKTPSGTGATEVNVGSSGTKSLWRDLLVCKDSGR